MSQVSKYFRGFSNHSSDPDHTEAIWNNPVLSHPWSLFLILFLQPIKEQLGGLHAPPNSKHEIPLPSCMRGWEWAERCTITKASSPRNELGQEERRDRTGTQTWILLSSFKTDTWCHLVPITAAIHWDLPTEASRWKNEAEASCAWSPEHVPSISQLQKHLCPTAFCWTAVKIYSVRLLSEFLTSQPEAGWSQVCPWVAAGSERDHHFQGLDEMCHKGWAWSWVGWTSINRSDFPSLFINQHIHPERGLNWLYYGPKSK